MCLCLILINAQSALCFIVLLLIRARRVFEFHGLFYLKRKLFFPLIVTLVISARLFCVSKGTAGRIFTRNTDKS